MARRLNTVEDIFDEIGGFGKFQCLAVFLVTSMAMLFGYSMLLMSYAGYISDFVCLTHSEQDHQPLTTLYTDRHGSSQSETTGWGDDVQNNTTLNVCSVNVELGVRPSLDEGNYYFSPDGRGVVGGAHRRTERRLLWAEENVLWFCCSARHLKYHSSFLCQLANGYGDAFLIGLVMGGALVVEFYPIEFLPTRWRHVVPLMPCWPIGMMAFAGTAYWLEDWSHLHIATAVLGATLLLDYFYMPESPRWLATQGRLAESQAALAKMAKTNRKSLPQAAIRVIESIADEKRWTDEGKKYTYLDLFKNPQSLKVSLIFGFHWVTLSVTYYGINFAVSSFAGNLYLNIFLMSVAQVPSYFIPMVLIGRTLGYGFASLAARAGSVLAPILINLDKWPLFSFILLAIIDFISVLLILFIPETNKIAMVETLRVHTDLDLSSSAHCEVKYGSRQECIKLRTNSELED